MEWEKNVHNKTGKWLFFWGKKDKNKKTKKRFKGKWRPSTQQIASGVISSR
jgi:hypothetical protein